MRPPLTAGAVNDWGATRFGAAKLFYAFRSSPVSSDPELNCRGVVSPPHDLNIMRLLQITVQNKQGELFVSLIQTSRDIDVRNLVQARNFVSGRFHQDIQHSAAPISERPTVGIVNARCESLIK